MGRYLEAMTMSTEGAAKVRPRRRMSAPARREVIIEAASAVFAEHGYRGASIDQIATRSGVTAPVVYDHFSSKRDLYRALLERHFANLREVWRQHYGGDDQPQERLARSLEAWFAYIEANPFAARLLFRDSSGDPEIAAMHRAVAARSREAIFPLLSAELPSAAPGDGHSEALEMSWVILREVLQGLAIWWSEHPEVPRQRLVEAAMNGLWLGFERVSGGELWRRDAGSS